MRKITLPKEFLYPSLFLSALLCACMPHSGRGVELRVDTKTLALGTIPPGWQDKGISRVNCNWARDGKGFLRVVNKNEQGLLLYPCEGQESMIRARFKKTPDPEVYFGLLLHFKDNKNYYTARFYGDQRLEIVKVADGKESTLSYWVSRRRYQEGQLWTLSMETKGKFITTILLDEKGGEQARLDVMEKALTEGKYAGVSATTYAACDQIILIGESLPTDAPEDSSGITKARVLRPVPADEIDMLNTPFEKISDTYDVVIAGAGTGGWAAAVQAARLGAKVLLLEESDWIGGQMAAAAVTTMDEEGCWEKFPVRERGIYREFHESITNFYYTMDKDPFRAYYAWPEQLEGGYEPKIARAILYGFIKDVRENGGVLDLVLRSKVQAVQKMGNTVQGLTVRHEGADRQVACKVLVDATEYGDVLPLTGMRYRLSNSIVEKKENGKLWGADGREVDPQGIIQYHTWCGVIREYPGGVPEHLQIKTPPPGFDAKRYRGSQLYGHFIWGGAGRDYKGPRTWRVLFAWRGQADSDSPATGNLSQSRHTQCGLNGGRQDYPVTVASVEDPVKRREAERDGVYRTLSEIYYFQQVLGLPWGVAEDEGYDTPHNWATMKSLGLRPDLEKIAVHLPQWPYVREARRMIGVYTLKASDLGRWKKATLFPTSVAMGDYFMDLDHGPTRHAREADLDPGEPPRGGGPFQVPFESFIPETLDGFIAAEKNISQSRLVNGATRLQPITMLTGQAAGAIAALAVRESLQPRELNPIHVQEALLQAGSNLIQRWYEDVAWGTPLWRASQLLALHQVMDAKGDFNKVREEGIGEGNFWNPDTTLSPEDRAKAVKRLAVLTGKRAAEIDSMLANADKRGEFAIRAMDYLVKNGKPDWRPGK